LLVFVLLSGCSFLKAEPASYLPNYLLSYPRSAIVAVQEPFHWQKTDWLKAGGVILITGGLFLADEQIRDICRKNQSEELDGIAFIPRQFGEIRFMLPAAGLTALAGYAFGSDKTVDTGLLGLKSILIAGATTRTLQLITQRERPFEESGSDFWNGPGLKWDRDSFPSGHSTVAWSIAPILAAQYSDQVWVAPLVYSLATLTSLSRVYEDFHWSSDVFAGAVVGYLAARLTLISTPRLRVTPCATNPGISLYYTF
jgi:membrane-associated phospholipid phosphatase